jgi:hypothetical protein
MKLNPFYNRVTNPFMEKYNTVQIMRKAVIAMLILTLLVTFGTLAIVKSNAYVVSQDSQSFHGSFRTVLGITPNYNAQGTSGQGGNVKFTYIYIGAIQNYMSPTYIKMNIPTYFSGTWTDSGIYDNIIIKSSSGDVIGHGKITWNKPSGWIQFNFVDYNYGSLMGAQWLYLYDSDNTTLISDSSHWASNGMGTISCQGTTPGADVPGFTGNFEFASKYNTVKVVLKTSSPTISYVSNFNTIYRTDYVGNLYGTYSGSPYYRINIIRSGFTDGDTRIYSSKMYVKDITNNYVYLDESTYTNVNTFVEVYIYAPVNSINITNKFSILGVDSLTTDIVQVTSNVSYGNTVTGGLYDSLASTLIDGKVTLYDYNGNTLSTSDTYSGHYTFNVPSSLKNNYTYKLQATSTDYQSKDFFFKYPTDFVNKTNLAHDFYLTPIGGSGLNPVVWVQGDVRDILTSNYISTFNITLKDSTGATIQTYPSNTIRNNVWSYILSLPLYLTQGASYTLVCSASGYSPSQYDFIYPPQNNFLQANFDLATTNIIPSTGIIKTLVLDANTNNPIVGANIQLFNATPSWCYQQMTDGFGNASFTNLPYDTYRIEASANGYFGATKILQITGTNVYFVTIYMHKITSSYVPNPGNVTVIPSNTIIPSYNPSFGANPTAYPNGTYPGGVNNWFGGIFQLWGINDTFTQGLILAVIIILLTAGFFAAVGAIASPNDGKAGMILACIGAVLGFVVCGYCQLIPIWFVIVVVLIALAILLYFGRNTGGVG